MKNAFLFSLFLLLSSFMFNPLIASAEEVQTGLYIGTKDGNPTPIMAACSQSESCEFVRVKVGGKGVGGRIDLVFLDDNNNFVGDFTGTVTEETWSFDVTAPPGAKRLRLGMHGGSEAFMMEAVNTKDPSITYLYKYDSPPPSSGGGDTGGKEQCDPCALLNCPGWDNYMGKVDQIIGAIPPPPNWGQVAETFRNAIVPNLISEMGSMLGSAPAPPTPPPDMPGISVGAITNNPPSPQTVPNLKESGFNKGKLEAESPQIEFRQDDSGGFDIKDPVESIPDSPKSDPIPGETDPGEWGENMPKEQEAKPPIPSDSSEVPIGDPPIPGGNGDAPPIPGEGNDGPPMPGGGGDTPPTPGNSGGNEGSPRYKKHPDDPDGSG